MVIVFLNHTAKININKQTNKQVNIFLCRVRVFCGMSDFRVTHSSVSVPNLDDYLLFERVPSDVGKVTQVSDLDFEFEFIA